MRRRWDSSDGFPVAVDPGLGRAWLVHCYGMVGAGRDNDVDSGGGTELYAVIGQAPRHLDRNVTLLGRVVQGMELLAALPRGSGPLGLYEHPEQHVPISSVSVAADVPAAQRTRARSAAHRHTHLHRPTSRRGATATRTGSRCRPGASTYATCRSRCGRAVRRRLRISGAEGATPDAGPRRAAAASAAARARADHLLALRGAGVAPLLAQHLPPLGRQLLKAVEILAHRCLLGRRQRLESLPALAQRVALLRRQSMPVLETLPGLVALGG